MDPGEPVPGFAGEEEEQKEEPGCEARASPPTQPRGGGPARSAARAPGLSLANKCLWQCPRGPPAALVELGLASPDRRNRGSSGSGCLHPRPGAPCKGRRTRRGCSARGRGVSVRAAPGSYRTAPDRITRVAVPTPGRGCRCRELPPSLQRSPLGGSATGKE